MSDDATFDPDFDFRQDANGKDPDSHSKTLRRYHQLAWTRPLPDGTIFTLEDMGSKGYLRHESARGRFLLSSDTIVRTFANHMKMAPIISQLSEADREAALRRGYRIGGMILFPGVKIDGKHTINQARGTNREIEDRFDLTLECIRRFYLAESNPLGEALERNRSFFDLFTTFEGYVDFFDLQDLVTDDYAEVRFWAPFERFETSALPATLDSYLNYRENMLAWVDSRTERIAQRVSASR